MEREEILRLYEQYAEDVYRLALSYLRCKQDAEDVCHAVFMKLLERREALTKGKEKAWLLTCTANACKNRLRSFWKRNVGALEGDIVSSCDEEQELWQNVCALAPKDRAVIHLYYYEGYAQDEIAEILRISRTAVQTRMARAREKLKEALRNDE